MRHFTAPYNPQQNEVVKIQIVQVKKLDVRSKLVVTLGKEPGTKAYHLYDTNTNTIHVSGDVFFEEEKC